MKLDEIITGLDTIHAAMKRPPRRNFAALTALLDRCNELLDACAQIDAREVAPAQGHMITVAAVVGDNESGLTRHKLRLEGMLERAK